MADRSPGFGAVDVTNCDREPIHTPGSVQPHGVLLVLDGATGPVARAAGDGPGLLGRDTAALPGSDLDDLLDAPTLARTRRVLVEDAPAQPVYVPGAATRAGDPIELAVHVSGGHPIVEIEPALGEDCDPLALVRTLMSRLPDALDLDGFLEALAHAVREMTGYARVMVYRFEPDDSGTVVAEDRREDLEPYLGLRYPASDIPRQARALYLRNGLRVVPDAAALAAPIVPPDPADAPLDLSHALLRAVSPMHLAYMANMGVRASMSLSLVVEGRLWGLVACHHDEPRRLSHMRRAACELAAQVVSLQLAEKVARRRSDARMRAAAIHAALFEALSRAKDLVSALLSGSPTLLDLVSATGAAVVVDGAISRIGRAPEEAALADLVARLGESVPDGVHTTDRLAELHPPADTFADVASGVLAISLSRSPRDWVLWFRPEKVRTVTWAGNPHKPVVATPDGVTLTPRASFAAWIETVRGRAEPFSSDEIAAAQALRTSIMEVVLRRLDELSREREKARARQDVLIAELDHRVKNTLATIQSLVKYSAANAESLESFTRTVQTRLHAMARTHDLLTRARWSGADLATLVAQESAPYGGDARIRTSGPPVELVPRAALALSLALHELATNAAKYGSLSRPEGLVCVAWSFDHDKNRLVLVWRETGGPPVAPPTRRGFGRTLLERSLAFDLDGRVSLDFARDGLVCTAEIPLDRLVAAPASNVPKPAGGVVAGVRGEANDAHLVGGRRVLVVEDQALIAMEVQDELEDAGVCVVGPHGRVAPAVAAAETELLDAALVDVALDGERSWAVADALVARGIPFALTTGFQAEIVFPERFRRMPVLAKPYEEGAILALVRDLVASPRTGS